MDSQVNCICEVMEKIDGFHSIGEFERFQLYIENLVTNGDLIEKPVKKAYGGFKEQWFKCSVCSQTWRLVHPDFPFTGIWDKVR